MDVQRELRAICRKGHEYAESLPDRVQEMRGNRHHRSPEGSGRLEIHCKKCHKPVAFVAVEEV